MRGDELRDARKWAIGRSLGDRDYRFLAASEDLEKRQTEVALEQANKARELDKQERELERIKAKNKLDIERKKAELELDIERKNTEAEKQANNILRKATKEANRRIRIGSIILVSTLLLSLFVVTTAELARQNALTATQLEQNGINLLRQVNQQPNTNIDDLLSAMPTGRELKSLVKQKQSLADYQAYSPVFSLQTILLNIREKNSLEGHEESVNSVVYSLDGKTLASASSDNSIKLWNVATRKPIYTLPRHKNEVMRNEVTSIFYSPNGKTLASASDDGTIKLWNLDLDSLLVQGCRWLDSYLATHPDVAKELCPKQ